MVARGGCIVAGAEGLARALEVLQVGILMRRNLGGSGERVAKRGAIMKLKGYARTVLLERSQLLLWRSDRDTAPRLKGI